MKQFNLNLVLFVTLLFGSLVLGEENQKSRQELEEILLAKEGRVLPVEEFKEVLKQLNRIHKAPKGLVDTLVLLDETKICSDHYMVLLAGLLFKWPQQINVVSHIKYLQEKYYKRCQDSMTKTYVERYNEMNEKLRVETAELREEIKKANGDQFADQKPFYEREALLKGLLQLLTIRSKRLNPKMDPKKSIKAEEFKALYEKNIVQPCVDLFNDESAKKFVERSLLYLNQIGHDERLVKLFNSDFKNFMTRAHICIDVVLNKTLADDVYEYSRLKQKKCFLKSCFN